MLLLIISNIILLNYCIACLKFVIIYSIGILFINKST